MRDINYYEGVINMAEKTVNLIKAYKKSHYLKDKYSLGDWLTTMLHTERAWASESQEVILSDMEQSRSERQ